MSCGWIVRLKGRYTNLADRWPPPPYKVRKFSARGTGERPRSRSASRKHLQTTPNKAAVAPRRQLPAGEPRLTSRQTVVSRNDHLNRSASDTILVTNTIQTFYGCRCDNKTSDELQTCHDVPICFLQVSILFHSNLNLHCL